MDWKGQERYQGVHPRPEFSLNEIDGRTRGRALFGRPPRHAGGGRLGLRGLAIPQLAAASKPYLGEAIVVILTLAFLRVDPDELFHHFTRPGLTAAATIWAMLVVPTVLGLGFLGLGLDRRMPGLYFMLVLQMSAPGLMSSPALAGLIGSMSH